MLTDQPTAASQQFGISGNDASLELTSEAFFFGAME
jgi:hypothetical protein